MKICGIFVSFFKKKLLNVCFQHDVSAGALKTALDNVVQECVSFVGVDINICSEMLMR